MRRLVAIAVFILSVISNDAQMDVGLPFTINSPRQLVRARSGVPPGRKPTIRDARLIFYGDNSTESTGSYRFSNIKRLLTDNEFDLKRPTVVYVHGYLELLEDDSVQTVVEAYLTRGGYNILVLDWSNLAFGPYRTVATNVEGIGRETGRALGRLIKGGLNLAGIHLVGHSLGSHIVSATARFMSDNNMRVSRITGLDPALPGFYPPFGILGYPMSEDDAEFVDAIHTDGGRYGTPLKTAHADFWPNGGYARQPGCPLNSIFLSYEDFCSHWRSWHFWAESVTGGEFDARECSSYDDFSRGDCKEHPVAPMGLQAKSGLYGNFYLRTASESPYSLGMHGAV